MKEYTIREYEQEDFDFIIQNMTAERAAEILEGLPRGWFHYRLPKWCSEVSENDFDNYKICCAIWFAISVLRGESKEE